MLTDVTDWQSQMNAFKSAINFSSRKSLDIVVAAAGVAGQPFIGKNEEPPSLEQDPPQPPSAHLSLDVNAKGVYYTSKLAQHYFALPSLSHPKATTKFRKCLVVICSLAGYLEIGDVDYTTSKWAVRGLFRSARWKMEDLGYRMNLIAPWVMDTPMSKGLAEECRINGLPVGDANDVAKAVIRCVADDTICGKKIELGFGYVATNIAIGRALAIGAAETFDLRDDLEGLNAGIKMKEYLEGEAREFMKYIGQRV